MSNENETKIRDLEGQSGTESPAKSPAGVPDLSALLARVVAATGPDAHIDLALHKRFPLPWLRQRGRNRIESAPQYTASVDAALSLVGRELPGWIWRLCTCSVSDDAWVCPDFNHPIYGEGLQAKFNDAFDGRDPAEVIIEATDVARHPSGFVALALIEAMLRGMIFTADVSREAAAA